MAGKINRCIFLLQMIAIWASFGDFGKRGFAQSNADSTVIENREMNLGQHTALPDRQLRCQHLQSLRRQYYKFLSASIQMAETAEFADLSRDNEASRYNDDAAVLQVARLSYEETWGQVEKDMKDANDSSEMFMNQCYAGESCASDVWIRGCYTCMPRKDRSLPLGCSHDCRSNELLNTIERNMRKIEDTPVDLNCIGDSITRKSMEDVTKQVERFGAILDEECTPENVANPTSLQAVYDSAHNLQYNIDKMRSAMKQQYNNLTIQCTQPYTKLSVNGISIVTDQFSEQALKINIDDSSSCSKAILLGGTVHETPEGYCWSFAKDTATSTESTYSYTTASLSESTDTTHLIHPTNTGNVTATQSTTEMIHSQSTTSSHAITSSTVAPEFSTTQTAPTATEATCMADLHSMITALNKGMPNIMLESAKVSEKIAECMRGASSVAEMVEVIDMISLYKRKLQTLFVDARKTRNAGLVNYNSFATLAKQMDLKGDGRKGECNQRGRTLDETLGELGTAVDQLKESPLSQDKQNRVLCLAQNIANILGQSEDTY